MLDEFAKLKVVPLCVIGIINFNLVLHHELKMLWKFLKRSPQRDHVKLVVLFVLKSVVLEVVRQCYLVR